MSKRPWKGESPNVIQAVAGFSNKTQAKKRAAGRKRAAQMSGGFNPKTPLPTDGPPALCPGPESENGAHHYRIDAYAGRVQTGQCIHCGAVKTWTLEPIASVVPQSYERDGAEYLRSFR